MSHYQNTPIDYSPPTYRKSPPDSRKVQVNTLLIEVSTCANCMLLDRDLQKMYYHFMVTLIKSNEVIVSDESQIKRSYITRDMSRLIITLPLHVREYTNLLR